MSLDPGLVSVVEDALPTMNSLDLESLRNAAVPILRGWALASPLGDTDRDPSTSAQRTVPHNDIQVVVVDGQFGKDEVVDYAYATTSTIYDSNNHPIKISHWALASGHVVTDTAGNPIAHPSLAQVLASPRTDGGNWTTLKGDLISFVERYIGESLPVDKTMLEENGRAHAGMGL